MAASAKARKEISGGVSAGTLKLVSDVQKVLAANNEKGYHRQSKASNARPVSASWEFSGKLDKNLRNMMKKSWKQVSNALRGQDTRRKKSLHGGVFRRTLSRFGVHLNDKDLKHLRHKFGTASHIASKKNLSIDYVSFLKHYTPAANSKTVTRRRPSTALSRRSGSARGFVSSRLAKSASKVESQEYNPSARQFETSLNAHVKKALQIANAPADRRALKAALASARSNGSFTQRSRALSRGLPGSRSRFRANSDSMRRSLNRSASAQSFKRNGKFHGGVGPVIVKTSRRNLGDTGPPSGRSSSRGQNFLNRRLSKTNLLDRSLSSSGLMGETAGSFGSTSDLSLRTSMASGPVNGNRLVYNRQEDVESETGSLFRGSTPNVPPTQINGNVNADPQKLRSMSSRIKNAIKDSWKLIRQDFKASDPSRSGSVPARTFRSLMARHDVILTEDEFYLVMQGFSREVGSNRNVYYDRFLRMILR